MAWIKIGKIFPGSLLNTKIPMTTILGSVKFPTAKSMCLREQWCSKGGNIYPGARALGAHQHTFCGYLKTYFKQKFRPKHA